MKSKHILRVSADMKPKLAIRAIVPWSQEQRASQMDIEDQGQHTSNFLYETQKDNASLFIYRTLTHYTSHI